MEITLANIILIVGAIIVIMLILFWYLIKNNATTSASIVDKNWEPVKRGINSKFKLVNGFRDYASKNSELSDDDYLIEQIDKVLNSYVNSYKKYGPKNLLAADLRMSKRVLPEIEKLLSSELSETTFNSLSKFTEAYEKLVDHSEEAEDKYNKSVYKHNSKISKFPSSSICRFHHISRKTPIAENEF